MGRTLTPCTCNGRSAQDELGMKEAELEALANMGIGKGKYHLAKQMETEGHKEAEHDPSGKGQTL